MFEIHPSMRTINENVNIVAKFSFSEVNVADGYSSKSFETNDIICELLMNIWNTEIAQK